MNLNFATQGWEDYLYWQTQDRKTLKRINNLIRDIMRGDGSEGIGKPELLRGDLSGWSSRRIDEQNRLVYRVDVEKDTLHIAMSRYHYTD